HLHAGEVLAQALVGAVAEGEVVGGVVAVDVDEIGVLEATAVVVAGGGDHEDSRALGDGDATDLGGLRRDAAPRGLGPVVPQALLDGIGDERGVGADLVPDDAVRHEGLDGVGDAVGRRLVGGDDAGQHQRVQVGAGDAPALGGLRRDAARRGLGPVGPQALLAGIGDGRGVGADLVPDDAVLHEELAGVGDAVGRRLVGGDDAGHHHRVQVGVGDD